MLLVVFAKTDWLMHPFDGKKPRQIEEGQNVKLVCFVFCAHEKCGKWRITDFMISIAKFIVDDFVFF